MSKLCPTGVHLVYWISRVESGTPGDHRMTDTQSIYTLYAALSAPAAPGANPHG